MTRKNSTKKRVQSINDKERLFRPKFFIWIGIVLTLSLLCNFICFFHSSRTDSHLFADRLSSSQLISSFDFSYESEVETKNRQKSMEDMVLPSYKINNSYFLSTSEGVKSFIEELKEIASIYATLSEQEKANFEIYEEYSNILRKESGLDINPYDLKVLLDAKEIASFDSFFNLIYYPFKNISLDGIYEDSNKTFARAANSNLNLSVGNSTILRSKRESQARIELRYAINSLGMGEELSNVAFRLFSPLLHANLEYDEQRTLEKKKEATEKVSPVIVNVREGEVLVEPAMELTASVREKLAAYRKERASRSTTEYSIMGTLSDFTISIFLISAAALFITVSKNPKTRKKQTIFSMLMLFIFNLGIVRILIDVLDKTDVGDNTPWLLVFAYALPILIGPLCQVLIAGAYTGFIMSLLLSSFTTLMLGESIEYLIITFVASLIAIYYCEYAKTRSRILTGAFFYGIALAFGCILTGLVSQSRFDILFTQSVVAITSALLCALLTMILLPLVERIFNACSNITLFELTNFNRPLLYKFQMTAPGSFHHSIMVAQLAEHAAKSIRANDLLCRAGALYHDIGKLAKPEFFTENQRGMGNPHDNQSPSMSALIIKNHVKEGIEIARISKLPKLIVDMIMEHHGTSLIAYFHNKAIKLSEAQAKENGGVPFEVDESTYRYEEQKPATSESTILMLADSCEAASRSLKKITPQAIDELISKIINGKISDGQLDNSPITIRQLSTIKESFAFTILNMNHTRVEYPDDKKVSKK